ncbi:hypothetical protein [Legionella worsleiensis]|uniref:hypothetical protein n=1 Tax=Legionella worsleiensis TaxID=45076 RepID=UPI0012ED81B3|nr:hypothetical protein [Legionella worsleiensis]
MKRVLDFQVIAKVYPIQFIYNQSYLLKRVTIRQCKDYIAIGIVPFHEYPAH